MIFPAFIKQGETIGISAPSAGVGRKTEDFQKSVNCLMKQGYSVIETASVRNNGVVSADAQTRGKELVSLFEMDEVAMVMCAAGGDFLDEILPYTDFEEMKKHPKWLVGASDPTGILFPYTVNCDVATIYGVNAGSFDLSPLPKYLRNSLKILSGDLIEQKSFSRYMKTPSFLAEKIEMDTPVRWKSTVGDLNARGRCIGGCIDVLKDLIGTPYEKTNAFVRKYAADGIIWYFDNFSMSAEVMYRTLLQMRYAGWFENTRAIIIGRVLFESSDTGMTYAEGYQKAFPDIPVIYEADIGHTMPSFTMINGALMDLSYNKGKAGISFTLQ